MTLCTEAVNLLRPRLEYPPFQPPRWLRNPHVQTLITSTRSRRLDYGWTESETMHFDIGAAGKITAEASWQPGQRETRPVLILLHGLEGSARSHYLVGISKKAYCEGFHTIRLNTRNCGGSEHLTPTLYCAALSDDVAAVVDHLQQGMGIADVFAAGVSLGANILLKFLGEQGEGGRDRIRAAAVVSPPIELAAGVARMTERQNWIYHRHFVRNLIRRMHRKTRLFPGLGDMRRIRRIRSIYEFDDIVTAPHFGFGTADNYYRLASSGPLLRDIRVPTLIVQAMDDPMIPFESFSRCGIEDNPWIELLATRNGGHTGFLGARPASPADRDAYWAECRVVQFLSAARERANVGMSAAPG